MKRRELKKKNIKINYGSILKKKKLKFNSQQELQNYYNEKYREKGYAEGFKLFGINLSNIYHKHRQKNSLELLNPKKDEIILDAGCGIGEFTKRIAKKCLKVYGVDVSEIVIKKAKKNSPKNCIFRQGDLENLNFSNQFFDKIISIETIEHVLHPTKVLKEFNRLLKKEGKLVICIPTINTSIISKIQIFLKISKFISISEHLHEWSYSEFKKYVEKRGFVFLDSKGVFLNLGQLNLLRRINKEMMIFLTNFQLSITNFPRNSSWVVMLFQRK
jgi:ubiquinone/menaquinone biosynthesis C-methylase UbiE